MSPTANVVAGTTAPTIAATQTPAKAPSSEAKSDIPTKRPGIAPTKAPEMVKTDKPTKESGAAPTKTPKKAKSDKTTAPPDSAPTLAPKQKTASPTLTLVRRSSPFEIVFGLPGGGDDGSDDFDAFMAAQVAVLDVLESYFVARFEERDDIVIASFDGEMIESDPSIPSASFIIEITFDPTSEYSPSAQEIDILVEVATTDDTPNFLAAFAGLGPENPYSEVTTIQYIPRPDLAVDSRGGKKPKLADVAAFSVTPFRLSFTGVNTDDVSVEATMAVTRTTLNYLDEYLSMTFDAVKKNVYSHLTGDGKSSGNGQVAFIVTLQLADGLDSSYTRQELDSAVEMAFSLPSVEAFVISLHALSADNPYSSVTKTDFQFMPDFRSDELRSKSSFMSPAMIGSLALFGLCLCATVCMIAYTCCKPKKERTTPQSVRKDSYIPIHGDFDSTSSETRVPLGQRHGGQEEFDLSIDSGNDPLIWWSGSSDQS
jgi:hypothetical protein